MSMYDRYGVSKSLSSLLEKRAVELFGICDVEGKGFINKRDMQRMCHTEPAFTPDMLAEVFETLDTDGNGFVMVLLLFTFE